MEAQKGDCQPRCVLEAASGQESIGKGRSLGPHSRRGALGSLPGSMSFFLLDLCYPRNLAYVIFSLQIGAQEKGGGHPPCLRLQRKPVPLACWCLDST